MFLTVHSRLTIVLCTVLIEFYFSDSVNLVLLAFIMFYSYKALLSSGMMWYKCKHVHIDDDDVLTVNGGVE